MPKFYLSVVMYLRASVSTLRFTVENTSLYVSVSNNFDVSQTLYWTYIHVPAPFFSDFFRTKKKEFVEDLKTRTRQSLR